MHPRTQLRKPSLRDPLSRIARDEWTHARLAWKALRWIRDAYGTADLETALHEIFRNAHAYVGLGAITTVDDINALREYGYLCPSERIARRTLHAVVRPAAKTLLATRQPPARRSDNGLQPG